MQTFTRFFLVMLTAISLAACSGKTIIESDLGIKGAPDWVNEGTQAVDDEDGQRLQGVGMAPVMNDVSLQKATADSRARAELARILRTYVDSTLNDYTMSAGDTHAMTIERDIKTTTQLALSGSKILGHWKDDNTGDIYAFAELRLAIMDEMVAKSNELSTAFKAFYQQTGRSHFEQLIKTTKP